VSKKLALLSQVFMTFMMAASMSGLMSLFHSGLTREWLAAWPVQLLIAWPLAFCLTMVAWPAATRLAAATLRPRSGSEATSSSA